MGVYLNPGKEHFERAVRSDIFVDKTGLLSYLNAVINTEQKYVAVSRPRRLGKTMAANMICAFYDKSAESEELFAGVARNEILPEKITEVERSKVSEDGIELEDDMTLRELRKSADSKMNRHILTKSGDVRISHGEYNSGS